MDQEICPHATWTHAGTVNSHSLGSWTSVEETGKQRMNSQYTRCEADASQIPPVLKGKHSWVQSPLPEDFR